MNRVATLPTVSLVTVSYNNIENLKKTFNSIESQDYPYIESIIIDGGSSDGTLDEIKRFADSFSKSSTGKRTCKWISEKDNGIYNAINKGIKMASGDIIGCMWDVYYSSSSLSDLIDKLLSDNADAVHGDLLYVDENENIVRDWRTGVGRIKDGWMPGHPTLYVKSEIYKKYGLYNESISSAADFEFMARIFKDDATSITYMNQYAIKMFYGGYSTGGIKAYARSIVQSYHSLRINNYMFPGLIILKRIFKTLGQFFHHSDAGMKV